MWLNHVWLCYVLENHQWYLSQIRKDYWLHTSTFCRPHAVTERLSAGGASACSVYTLEISFWCERHLKIIKKTILLFLFVVKKFWKLSDNYQYVRKQLSVYCSKMEFSLGNWRFAKEGNFIFPGQRVTSTRAPRRRLPRRPLEVVRECPRNLREMAPIQTTEYTSALLAPGEECWRGRRGLETWRNRALPLTWQRC